MRMTGKEMTKEEITKAVELMKPIYDIEKPIQELMGGHYSLCGYAYNISMELTKYKRAFEILKDSMYIIFRQIADTYHINFETKEDFAEDIHFIVTKEEYELLKEVFGE
jgi:hypothetical protein